MAKKGKMSEINRAQKRKGRIIVLLVELVILSFLGLALVFILKWTGGASSLAGNNEDAANDGVSLLILEKDDVVINEEVKTLEVENPEIKKYWNIALFGVDSREGALKDKTLSDTIMIASINTETGEVRLLSVYRDTYLNIGDNSYTKCNAAYAHGGPLTSINMLNSNMDLNVTDFVTVGFRGLVDTVDALGGIMIDVDKSEREHLNNYQIELSEKLKKKYTPVSEIGYQLLDGMQATAYCRIRYTAGDDFKRAERQREVLSAIFEKAKTVSPAKLVKMAESIFGNVYTSLDLAKITELIGSLTSYKIVETDGFPFTEYRNTGNIGSAGSCVIPVDLERNVTKLHQFLYGSDGYAPSERVKAYSADIKRKTSPYIG